MHLCGGDGLLPRVAEFASPVRLGFSAPWLQLAPPPPDLEPPAASAKSLSSGLLTQGRQRLSAYLHPQLQPSRGKDSVSALSLVASRVLSLVEIPKEGRSRGFTGNSYLLHLRSVQEKPRDPEAELGWALSHPRKPPVWRGSSGTRTVAPPRRGSPQLRHEPEPAARGGG